MGGLAVFKAYATASRTRVRKQKGPHVFSHYPYEPYVDEFWSVTAEGPGLFPKPPTEQQSFLIENITADRSQ